jgi:hypothetical protein
MSDVTQMLNAIDAGDPKAAQELLPLVYEELRRLAAAKMARESPGQTLHPARDGEESARVNVPGTVAG